MQITSIKVRRIFDEGAMRAIVSVTLDDVLAIHGIKVICARGKFFIVMPSRKMPDESFRDIVHPINAEFRALLEHAVLAEYNREAERVRQEAIDGGQTAAPEEAAGGADAAFGIAQADENAESDGAAADDAFDAGQAAGNAAADAVGVSGVDAVSGADEVSDEAPKKRRTFFGLGF